jgi:hypothetical protein
LIFFETPKKKKRNKVELFSSKKKKKNKNKKKANLKLQTKHIKSMLFRIDSPEFQSITALDQFESRKRKQNFRFLLLCFDGINIVRSRDKFKMNEIK